MKVLYCLLASPVYPSTIYLLFWFLTQTISSRSSFGTGWSSISIVVRCNSWIVSWCVVVAKQAMAQPMLILSVFVEGILCHNAATNPWRIRPNDFSVVTYWLLGGILGVVDHFVVPVLNQWCIIYFYCGWILRKSHFRSPRHVFSNGWTVCYLKKNRRITSRQTCRIDC